MANEIRLRSNFFSGTITDNPLTIGATTINSALFANLPTVDATNHLVLVLDPTGIFGAPEIVRVTAHTAAATSVTVTRGVESSTARQHNTGETWYWGPTVEDFLNSTTSGARPSVPFTGEIIYERDTTTYSGYTGTAWQSLINTGVWTDWTPVVTQGVAVTTTVNRAKYMKIGRNVFIAADVAVQTNGTAGQGVVITGLPFVAAASGFLVIGGGNIFDSSAATDYVGFLRFQGSNNSLTMLSTANAASNNILGLTSFTAALANPDNIKFSGFYEAST